MEYNTTLMESSAELQNHNGSSMTIEEAIGLNRNLTYQNVSEPVSEYVSYQDGINLWIWARANLKYISIIGGFLLLVLGTAGNLISIAVMRRERMKSAVVVIYLMALALTDTTFLWVNSVQWSLANTINVNVRDLNQDMCKFLMFLTNFLYMLSAWIIAFISVQRMLVVLLPYKAKQIATRNKTLVSLLVLIPTLMAYNTFLLINFIDSCSSTVTQCPSGLNHKKFRRNFWSLIFVLTTLVILPFSTILIANVILITKFIQSKIKKNGQTKRITTTLISVSLIFLILNTPCDIILYLLPTPPWRYKYVILFSILRECNTFLINLNSAINFLLYCFTWPTFRTELCIMMREWCSCFRSNHSVRNQRGQNTLTGAATHTSTITLNVLSSLNEGEASIYVLPL